MPAEKVYERYAWVLPFLTGIGASPAVYLTLIASPQGLVTGLIFLGFVILTVSVSVTAFRTGRKWAWYTLWYVPLFGAVITYVNVVTGQTPAFPNALLLAIPVLALLLPFRRFFPRRAGT